jgi:predicted small secreted protein
MTYQRFKLPNPQTVAAGKNRVATLFSKQHIENEAVLETVATVARGNAPIQGSGAGTGAEGGYGQPRARDKNKTAKIKLVII